MLKLENIYKTFNAGTVNEKVALNGLNLQLNDGVRGLVVVDHDQPVAVGHRIQCGQTIVIHVQVGQVL